MRMVDSIRKVKIDCDEKNQKILNICLKTTFIQWIFSKFINTKSF